MLFGNIYIYIYITSIIDKKRYVLLGVGVADSKLYLRSPPVRFAKACFHFSYFARLTWDSPFLGRLFVFVKRLHDGKKFPVWSQDVLYGHESKWNDIQVEIALSSDEYEVN